MPVTIEMPSISLAPSSFQDLIRTNSYEIVTFGSYPCDWNGGRIYCKCDGRVQLGLWLAESDGKDLGADNGSYLLARGRQDVMDLVRRLNGIGIPFYATMTNIVPRDCDSAAEPLGFLDFLAESLPGKNGVIVAHPDIFRAIKERYGQRGSSPLKYQMSVISALAETGLTYGMAAEEFDSVCLRPEDLQPVREGLLDGGLAGRAVALVNHVCAPYCANARRHYENISILSKTTPPFSPIEEMEGIDWPDCRNNGSLVMAPWQVDMLKEEGIGTFKFGRRALIKQDAQRLFPELCGFMRDV